MKYVVLVLTLASAALAQINIDTPDCNFNISVKTPATTCCCPAVTPVPTTPAPEVPPGFVEYCCDPVTYTYPTCTEASNEMFPHVNDCNQYYRCTGLNTRAQFSCATGQKFSGMLRKCVTTTCTKCLL